NRSPARAFDRSRTPWRSFATGPDSWGRRPGSWGAIQMGRPITRWAASAGTRRRRTPSSPTSAGRRCFIGRARSGACGSAVSEREGGVGGVVDGELGGGAAISNGKAADPAQRLKDLGAFGTCGPAGKVRGGVVTAADDRRYLVGGGWNDPPYMAGSREARSPF